jgi:hypothetical protein
MNKPYNIQNTNTCNGIFHISFFKALLINEGETTWGEKGIGAKRLGANGNRGRNDSAGERECFDFFMQSGRELAYKYCILGKLLM